jgi:hypothetical protein
MCHTPLLWNYLKWLGFFDFNRVETKLGEGFSLHLTGLKVGRASFNCKRDAGFQDEGIS